LLIDEIIDKIVNCKHLTRLNIISVFNKLQMHFNNKNYITFITALEAYKYKMLLFELTNESISFQQYMNDILWNFLNDFSQVYLNDILIYSKTKKKHRDHVKLVLSRLREAELQMNIWKCKFNVKETVFLLLNWKTAKLLMTFYLEKIYCEFLRTCTRNYYKKCMINLLLKSCLDHSIKETRGWYVCIAL